MGNSAVTLSQYCIAARSETSFSLGGHHGDKLLVVDPAVRLDAGLPHHVVHVLLLQQTSFF